jgi:NitT/TauT family transport system substrate-binding protein
MSKRRSPLVSKALVLGLLVAAVVIAVPGTGGASSGGAKLTTVHFRTGFGVGSWDAGFYVARDKGFYRQAGLNVILEGGLGSFSNVQLVAAGKTQIAHVASPALITAAAQGAKIKVIASFIQVLGSGVMAQPEIKTPKDMCGKTFQGANFDITTTLFPTYLKSVGVDPNCVKQELSTLGNPTRDFANGADMVPALGWSEIPPAKVLGLKFNYFSYAKAGLIFLGPGLVVNSDWLADPANLKTARTFAVATARGWQYGEQHPIEAANIVSKAEKTLNRSWTTAIERVMPGFNYTVRTRGGPLGRMSILDMQDSMRSAVRTGLIKSEIPVGPLFQNVIPANSPYKVSRRPEIK